MKRKPKSQSQIGLDAIYLRALAHSHSNAQRFTAAQAIKKLKAIMNFPASVPSLASNKATFDGLLDGITLHLAEAGFGEEILEEMEELGITLGGPES